MEKILASCCQHVNGIRFEESTMTKYRTVGPGRGGAPLPFKILVSREANPFSPKGIPWITTLQLIPPPRLSDLLTVLKNCYLLAVTKNSRFTCAEKAFKERNNQQLNRQSEFRLEFLKNSATGAFNLQPLKTRKM